MAPPYNLRRLRQYLRILILIFSYIFISILFLAALKSAVRDHFESNWRNDSFLLAEQVNRAGNLASVDFNKISEEDTENLRQLFKRLCKPPSRIREISFIHSDTWVRLSSSDGLNEVPIKDNDTIADFRSMSRGILEEAFTDSTIEHDVYIQVNFKEQFRGVLRLNVVIPELEDGRSNERWIISTSGIFLLFAGFAYFYLAFTSRRIPLPGGELINQPTPGIETTDVPSIAPEDQSLPDKNNEQIDTLFMNLNRLYDDTGDLDRTFSDSEKKIHYMMRVLNQGSIILDLDMNLISYNEFMLDVLRFRTTSNASVKIEEIIRKNPQFSDIHQRAKDPMTHEVKTGVALSLLNGSKIHVEVLAHAFYNGKDILGVIIYFKDTKVLKELEHSLQRSMKYGVISQLASSIGHEIRNPLSSLAIHTEIVDSMVERSIEDPNRLKKIQKSIGILNSEVERLNKLIDQFFKLAKTREASLSLEHINDLMNEVVDLVYQQALEKRINITKHFGSSLPMVKISKDQLKQVIINLVLNAYDAIGEAGEVCMRTEFRDNKVVVSVEDSGGGIPVDVQKNIFDLYFTTKTSGGGIGLAISRKIVEAHEGRLYFETQHNIGTTFFIELPTMQN